MDTYVEEFLEFLEKEDDPDYGDFKREVDLHLLRMAAGLKPMTNERLLRLQNSEKSFCGCIMTRFLR